MPTVRIKSKVVKSTLQNKDVLDMFSSVLNGNIEGKSSIHILYPKYLKLYSSISRYLRVLTTFQEVEFLEKFQELKNMLINYVQILTNQFQSTYCAPSFVEYVGEHPELNGSPEMYEKIPDNLVAKFNEVFMNQKKCSIINTILLTCKNLVVHKKYLESMENLSDKFLLQSEGILWCPFPNLNFNFKQIYIDEKINENNKLFILTVLHKLYTIGKEVYENVTSPDVDLTEFVEVIMSSVGEVRKHIPRCDQAFDKIIESVDLLRDNFTGYYKDFVSSNNPTIIMENFVMDVSKSTKSSPSVTIQFRKIIAHYRKIAQQQGATNHPKLQTLFNQVDINFQELEKSTPKTTEEEVKTEPDKPSTNNKKNIKRRLRRKAKVVKEEVEEIEEVEEFDDEKE